MSRRGNGGTCRGGSWQSAHNSLDHSVALPDTGGASVRGLPARLRARRGWPSKRAGVAEGRSARASELRCLKGVHQRPGRPRRPAHRASRGRTGAQPAEFDQPRLAAPRLFGLASLPRGPSTVPQGFMGIFLCMVDEGAWRDRLKGVAEHRHALLRIATHHHASPRIALRADYFKMPALRVQPSTINHLTVARR